MDHFKPVGIWIRVSTEDQALGDSPEHHETRARYYAEAKQWKAREVYHLEAASANELSATVWHGEGGLDPMVSVGNYFPNGGGSLWAPLFGSWYVSSGEEGEEPPPYMREQMELYHQIEGSGDADEQAEMMGRLLEIAKEQFYIIGIVRQTEKYFVAANNIHNLPDEMIQGWAYPSPGPTRPEQYFID
jgi:peptide/nickel transport system substrate-binding protein